MATIAKEAAGKKAAELVEDGMIVGLGTGSTTRFFISELGKRCRSGLRIKAVATSLASQQQAEKEGIPLIAINTIDTIDLDVDGADEIDPLKRMIKGGGGALFREKIIAGMSKEMIVIVDESKTVEYLGKFPLPIEISSFGHLATLRHLKEKSFIGTLRKTPQLTPFITDNNNLIVDIQLPYPCLNPEEVDKQIKAIPGVIETGFFFELAGRVLIGQNNGKVKID
jgi:ribose 5-phosphate isomerase A